MVAHCASPIPAVDDDIDALAAAVGVLATTTYFDICAICAQDMTLVNEVCVCERCETPTLAEFEALSPAQQAKIDPSWVHFLHTPTPTVADTHLGFEGQCFDCGFHSSAVTRQNLCAQCCKCPLCLQHNITAAA
jgi:hypothetical protein